MWTVVKIIGAISAALLTLAFIVLLILVTRPAVLLGVSDDSMSFSVSRNNEIPDSGESSGADCRKREDGEWRCIVSGGRMPGQLELDVNWMGCWTASRLSPGAVTDDPKGLKGCVSLSDAVHFD